MVDLTEEQEEDIKQKVNECFSKFETNKDKKDAIKTLKWMLSSIYNKPTDEKIRSINITNALFKGPVAKNPSIKKLLTDIGFR